jgi:dTDP-glucose 4,6-dehydratase
VNPQPESYWGNVNPISPRGVYDEAKRFAEAITMAYHRYHGLDTRIARIFNTFGPRMRFNDGRVISNFIVQTLQGKPLTVYGDGMQTRSFCYVDDLVRGLVGLLWAESDRTPEQRTDRAFFYERNGHAEAASIHEPVNIGNPEERTVIDIARLIHRLVGQDTGIQHLPLLADDPKVRRPNIDLAKQRLQWEPVVPLEDGLVWTIEYFEAELKTMAGTPDTVAVP